MVLYVDMIMVGVMLDMQLDSCLVIELIIHLKTIAGLNKYKIMKSINEGYGRLHVDVGANEGDCIDYARNESDTFVLAFEPVPKLCTKMLSKTSVEIMGVFQKLNAQGITVVMVTHELDIAHYCKRNLIMRDGRLVSDTPVVDRLVATEQMQRIVTAETDAKLIA